MSLFRKQATGSTTPGEHEGTQTAGTSAHPLVNGPSVDIDAVYRSAKLTAEELDRVARAEALLHQLPTKGSNAREVVDVTFRAFGVDRTKIVEAATRQVQTLETFIRASHEETQRVHDLGAQRIAELEAEIQRCRGIVDQAASEGEQRARSVNDVLIRVQRVLSFFGDNPQALASGELDADTTVSRPDDDETSSPAKPTRPPKSTQRPTTP